ncbi:MAG: hypothetical protein KJ061_00710 [Vicinamibacteraceae bacterium]|nr:hypothetical protein [Vicinamibacteraceae bacterium]
MSRVTSPWRSRWFVVAVAAAALPLALAARPVAIGPIFPDDPLTREPETRDASGVAAREIPDLYDRVRHMMGDRSDEPLDQRALNVNTIDEVPDSSWFTNRIGTRPFTADEVRRGPNRSDGPAPGLWVIVSGKDEGATAGFEIVDAAGGRWLLKFDGREHPGMASSAEVISTKLLWALGYNVPENHVVAVRPELLHVAPKAMLQPFGARTRYMRQPDIAEIMRDASPNGDGTYRAVASRQLPGRPVGGFHFAGTRPDDPNDIVPHEHRRELRALRVFSAWINHTEIRASNTLDTLVPADSGDGLRVRHHLLDFGSTLGSWTFKSRPRWSGFETVWEGDGMLGRLFLLGLPVPRYAVMPVTESPEIGRLPDVNEFHPDTWRPRVTNAAFARLRDDDRFWAARRLAAFDDTLIEAAVDAARIESPAARAALLRLLAARRDRIVDDYVTKALPLATLSLSTDGKLRIDDLPAVTGAPSGPGTWRVEWFAYDPTSGAMTPVAKTEGAAGDALTMPRALRGDTVSPPGGALGGAASAAGAPATRRCVAATLERPDDPARAGQSALAVFCSSGEGEWRLVGLERRRL